MKIEGANIIVTGASSGIGAALGPDARGARRDRGTRRAGAPTGSRRCSPSAACTPPDSRAWPVDLGDLDAAEALVHQAAREFGARRLPREQRRRSRRASR